jgi:hypothetical protein
MSVASSPWLGSISRITEISEFLSQPRLRHKIWLPVFPLILQLKRFVMLFFHCLRSRPAAEPTGKKRCVLQFEALEDRPVPAAPVYTEYAQVAQLLAGTPGRLNFDGWKDNSSTRPPH